MKKSLLTILQILATVAIVWIVFRDPTKRGEMIRALRHADLVWLFGGFALYGLVEFIASWRWHILLKVQGVHLAFSRIYMLVMIGVFFNFIVPGGTGGDLVKTFYLLKEAPGKRLQALMAVLVDRIFGLLGMMLISAALIGARWDWLTKTFATKTWVYTTLVILGGSLAVLSLSSLLSGFGLLHKLPKRFPGRERIAEIGLAFNHYGRAWKASLLALIISIAANIGYFLTFHFAAEALRGPHQRVPSLTDVLTIMPIVNTITALPVSISGVGVREKLFEEFLQPLAGVTGGVAVAISSTGFLLTAAWGLLGALFYVIYRPTDHAKLAQIKEEIEVLEHEAAEAELAEEAARHPHRMRKP